MPILRCRQGSLFRCTPASKTFKLPTFLQPPPKHTHRTLLHTAHLEMTAKTQLLPLPDNIEQRLRNIEQCLYRASIQLAQMEMSAHRQTHKATLQLVLSEIIRLQTSLPTTKIDKYPPPEERIHHIHIELTNTVPLICATKQTQSLHLRWKYGFILTQLLTTCNRRIQLQRHASKQIHIGKLNHLTRKTLTMCNNQHFIPANTQAITHDPIKPNTSNTPKQHNATSYQDPSLR